MALHMTKIAFGSESADTLRQWLESHGDSEGGGQGEALITTRYLPTRHAEMMGGSLYWIHQHMLVGRSPLLGFAQREDGRWWVRLEPRLIAVHPQPRRAHQGWRYLAEADAPADIDAGASEEPLPARLVGELAKLGLV
ncbi:MAG: DUF1489 domain-containing protein [Novosphingobium sp.]|nr:DUF1489 domain-containing protein [Novosphingobium sp.]